MAISQHKGIKGLVHPDLKMDQPIGDLPERMSKARVNVPVRWQSAPNHPSTHLAYITDDEAALLKKMDIHKSGVRYEDHIGPAGLPSYDDRGSGLGGGTVSGGSAAGTEARQGDTVSGGSTSMGVSASSSGDAGKGGDRESPVYTSPTANQTATELNNQRAAADAKAAADAAAAKAAADKAAQDKAAADAKAAADKAAADKAAADAAAANALRIKAEQDAYIKQQQDYEAATKAAAENSARLAAEKATYEKQQADSLAAAQAAAVGKLPSFFSSGTYTVDPYSFGTPSILSQQYVGKLAGYTSTAPGPLRSTEVDIPSLNIPSGEVPFFATKEGMKTPFGYTQDKKTGEYSFKSPEGFKTIDFGDYAESAQKYSDPEAAKSLFSSIEKKYGLAPGSVQNIFKVESGFGNNPAAFNLSPTKSSGPFQFTLSTGEKYGLVGSGFDYRLDVEKSAEAAGKYLSDIAKNLAVSLGRQPTAGEIGLGYNQGTAGAKALLSNPNAKADEALAPAWGGSIEKARKAIINNGGDPDAPARDFSNKISGMYQERSSLPNTLMAGISDVATGIGTAVVDVTKAAISAPAKFADTLEGLLNTPPSSATSTNIPFPIPVSRPIAEAGSETLSPRTYTLDTMPNKAILAGDSEDAIRDAAKRASSSETGDYDLGNGYTVTSTGDVIKTPQTEKETAAQVASSSPKNFGEWLDSVFDTNSRIQELESQGKYAAMDKEQYAEDFANGDISKVKSRIVDYNDGRGPVVDYYVKGLDEVLADMVTAPFKAVGNLIGGVTEAPVYTTSSGGGDGGRDSSPTPTKTAAVTTPTTPPTTPVVPAEPDYSTGIRDLTSRVYTGNPLVAFDYSLLTKGLSA